MVQEFYIFILKKGFLVFSSLLHRVSFPDQDWIKPMKLQAAYVKIGPHAFSYREIAPKKISVILRLVHKRPDLFSSYI